ncbi:MAG: MFS transporter [Clostridia bacterium]|nr:MFS transporter [Clostridia bacterium]
MVKSFARVKTACYFTNITMSIVGNLSPLLFLTFNKFYGISFTLLGALVLINFFTQLTIDLIFSFFSHKFNIPLTVKLTPFIAVFGFLIYGLWPYIFPNNVFLGLVIGTVIFSSSSGLAEVLISPTIAAIPAKNPDREMSKLHSIYAWGVVGFVVLATLFLFLVGDDFWQILAMVSAIVPLISCILFIGQKIPEMETPQKVSGVINHLKNPTLWLSVFAIFLGGAAEVTMNQWASSYLETLGIDKLWGDVLGVALFGFALGLGRSLYAKIGKNIDRVIFFGAIVATVCYLVAALVPVSFVALIACALTGFCVSMFWPGNLIIVDKKIPHGGVFMYAMMAAGGDLGSSLGPQMVGALTDLALAGKFGAKIANMGLSFGLLISTVFPLLLIFVSLIIWKGKVKNTALNTLPLEGKVNN